MEATALVSRLAGIDDLPALRSLMDLAIGELQKPFLTETEIASSRTIMGLDTQLIEDGTYFVVEVEARIIGCGGWRRRATLYGGDQSPVCNTAPLDPLGRMLLACGPCTRTQRSRAAGLEK